MSTAVLWMGGAATALTLVGLLWQYVIRPVTRLVKFLDDLLEDLRGEPPRPGYAGRDGLLVRLGKIEEQQSDQGRRLAWIEHELRPNGGSSLRDQVDVVRQAVSPTDP